MTTGRAIHPIDRPPFPRLASVDALRGLTVAAMLLVNDPGDWGHVYWPLEHARWNGCTPTDLIFPFFLFVVGVSIALALGPKRERGAARAPLWRGAMVRALRILVLGLAINLLAAWLMPGAHLRLPGVLQRIALCFALAATCALYLRPRSQLALIVASLVGYAWLLHRGGMLPWENLISRSDSAVFGRFVYQTDPATGRGHDPEGLLGTLPALATTLLGLAAGRWLRGGRAHWLWPAGVILLLAGGAWSLVLPFNKNLWTPSFVLWTAGWATLALAACHVLVDGRGWPAIGRRFGVNAIAAYAGSELMQIVLPSTGLQQRLYDEGLARALVPLVGPYGASLAWALGFVALWWLIVWAMDRRAIYLKL
ncbi:acyltransferase family protein [Dyella sp.]|jgi:predicted acyltransferase|uniref:acyltransferase family protein n=1 Tax=Dyella sp. TaxID=1869338 RepID=UPI002D7A1956|nr:heparan-alpha-glucosaminide N-acetyltransferase domain-containing protein [Dyella sp.]HET6431565.1 heparan-alpha-glucosaminide N-acetyltransferase domain-containing protein [Dyella sp.]